MSRPPRSRLALMKPLPVLITESADEFSTLHDKLKDDLKPHGAIENFKVEEIAALIWEIHRYRRAKAITLNAIYPEALKSLLKRVWRQPGQTVSDIEEDIEELAYQWFDSDQRTKQRVLEKLAYFGLNEHAIEAEAMQIMASDLACFDQMLASLEWRFDRTVRSLAEFRGVLGEYLRETTERVIDGEVVALGSGSKKTAGRSLDA